MLLIEPSDFLPKIREILIQNVQKEGLVDLKDVFGLLILCHSISEDSYDSKLEELIVEEMKLKVENNVSSLDFLKEKEGEEDVRSIIQSFLNFLRPIRSLRLHFQQFG